MKNEPKKEVTIDDLALMVAQGFSTVDEKIDTGFKDVNGRLDKVEGRLDGVDGRLDGVEGRLDGIEEKLGVIETDVAVLKSDVKDIKANLNKKVDKIDHNTLTYQVEKLEKKFA